MSKKILVSVDPSSTRTGVAIWVGRKLTRCEAIKSSSSKKYAPHERALLHAKAVQEKIVHLVSLEVRGRAVVSCVVEVPGSQGRSHSRGLVTLGMAVGAVVAMLTENFDVQMIPANIWTRLEGGRAKSKDVRADQIQKMFPQYDRAADKGLDIADAIGIGAYRLGLFEKPADAS